MVRRGHMVLKATPFATMLLSFIMLVGSIAAGIVLGMTGEGVAAFFGSSMGVWSLIGLQEAMWHLLGKPGRTWVGRKFVAWMALLATMSASLFIGSFYYYGLSRPSVAIWATISGIAGLVTMLYYYLQWREHRHDVAYHAVMDSRRMKRVAL